MKQEEVIKVLKERKYSIKLIPTTEKNNMQYWHNDQRVIVVKEYRTESSFLEWLEDDQPIIGEIYTNLPSDLKNNLYFFMIINFIPDSLPTRLEINRAQKNQYVCKKYVIKATSDLDKIPFLKTRYVDTKRFDFDSKFKSYLNEKNEKDSTLENPSIESIGTDFIANTSKILSYYFDTYTDNEVAMDDLIVEILNEEEYE